MTTVNVSPSIPEPTHDISLTDGTNTYGLRFKGGTRALQEIPISQPAQYTEVEQKTFIGGRGRIRYLDDQSGFNDSQNLWTAQEGKMFQSLQWSFARGLRLQQFQLPGANENLGWWKLYGSVDTTNMTGVYLSNAFSPQSSFSATNGNLWIRRVGTPTSTLTFAVYTNSSGSPSASQRTDTVTTSTITDTISVFRQFSFSAYSLTGGTTYHVVVYTTGGSDDADNHWEVLVNTDGTTGKASSDGSSWSSAGVDLYYRVAESGKSRRLYFFNMHSSFFAVSQNDDGSNSELWQQGIRGKVTSAGSSTLTDSTQSMTTDQYVGAYLRIIDGPGDGQVVRVTANTGTQFTVTPAWSVQPTTSSYYVVYGTPYWDSITGHGLGECKSQPAVADKVAYFPQGQSVAMRRMRFNTTSGGFDFAADGSNKADVIYTFTDPKTGIKVFRSDASTSKISFSAAMQWGSNLSFGRETQIDSSDYRITRFHNHQGVLHIFKENGLFTFDNSILRKIGSVFDDIPDPRHGYAAITQEKYLWWSWAGSIERMIGESISDMLNWKSDMEGLPDERKGYVSAIASYLNMLFVAIDGGTSKTSSVLMWNGYGWHEIFRGFETGKAIRSLAVQPSPGTRTRLWIEIDGDAVYIDLPLYAINPLEDEDMNYQHEGVFISSTIDVGTPVLYKLIHSVNLYTDSLANGSIGVDYQTDNNVGTDTWTPLGTASSGGVDEVIANLGNVKKMRLRLRLNTTNTATPTVLNGWMVEGWILDQLKYQWNAVFALDSDADTYTGETDHNPDTLVSWLLEQATQMKKITVRSVVDTMDGKVVTLSAPVIVRNSIDTTEGTWNGSVQFIMREA